MQLQRVIETKLETATKNEVAAILDAKLQETTSFGIADYIEMSIGNLEARLDRIKQAEAELKAIKASTEEQINTIKEGVAEWLQDAGIDKLNGDRVSSVSVFERTAKEELIVTDEEALINLGYFKTVLDKTSVKNAIKDGAEIDGAHIDVTHHPVSLKVNRRRKREADDTH